MAANKLASIALGALFFLVIGALQAAAMTVTHQFSTTVNATEFGGGLNDQVTFQYTFDSAASPSSTRTHSSGGTFTVYDGVLGTLRYGSNVVNITNASLAVYNDWGLGNFNAQQIFARTGGASYSGTINGYAIGEFSLVTAFNSSLGSTAPITSTDFLNINRSHNINFGTDSSGTIFAQAYGNAAGTYTTPAPVPLPASGWLLIGGMGAVAALRRRKTVRSELA